MRLQSRLAGLVAACCLAGLAAQAGAQNAVTRRQTDKVMPFEVIVNGSKSGTWLLIERDGELYGPKDAIDEWRLKSRPDAAIIDFNGQSYVPLSSVPGFGARPDLLNQSMQLTFSPEAFAATRLSDGVAGRPLVGAVLPSVFFNYDLNYNTSQADSSNFVRDLGLLSELGFSSGAGILTSSQLARNIGGQLSNAGPSGFTRLETTFTRNFPDSNRVMRLGDTVTRAGLLGRNIYFGGAQLSSNYALTPGFVTQAIPTLTGLSATPSTVELYVNDVLRQVSNVPTGPFVLGNVSQIAGSGEARIVVRDVLGRETVIVQSFFSSAYLLAKGLNDWSIDVGAQRREIGLRSSQYGAGLATGTWRHGYSDTLTVEGRTELSRDLQAASAGFIAPLWGNMLGRSALMVSRRADYPSGTQWLLGVEQAGQRTSFTLQAQGASQGFRQLGEDPARSPTKLQIAGTASYGTLAAGTFGVGFATVRRYDEQPVTTVSANYALRLGRAASLNLSASRAMAGGNGTSVGVFLSFPLGDRMIGHAGFNSRGGQRDGYASVQQMPTPDNALNWRVLGGRQQNANRAEAGAYYNGQYGRVAADVSAAAGQSAVRLGAGGGLVYAGGSLFATDRVNESFALVEVAGYGGVGVGLGGQALTQTNAKGIALIPRLMPYQNNYIRLDASDLPINAELDNIEQVAVPVWRSAVKVDFPVRGGRGALLKIRLDDGDVAPAGAVLRIDGDKQEFYVARRGEAFVTGLQPVNRLRLDWNQSHCVFDVLLPTGQADSIARVGPLDCKGVLR